jgi:hypothetical protein
MFEKCNKAAEICIEYLWYFFTQFAQKLFGIFYGLRL